MSIQCGGVKVGFGGAGAGAGKGAAGCGTAGCGAGGCGFAECEEGPSADVISYVGNGCGDYRAETTYKYVGNGAGEFTVVSVPTKVPANYCFCLLSLLTLALLLLLALWLSRDKPTPPAGPPGNCKIFGDPHLVTFDGAHADYYTPGEYWLVRSSTVSIQGQYQPTRITHGLATTKAVAVGGAFLKGHVLVIGALSATWDHQPILTTFPGSFKVPGLVDITYNSQGETLQRGRDGKALHVVHVTLPNGVSMQINRWNEAGEGSYINVLLTMPKQPGQDGHCGNFNGNQADDDRMAVRARLGTQGVAPGDMLFDGPKTPIAPANRPDINNCPKPKLDMAEETCKKKEHSFFPSKACLIDVCFGGKIFARQDVI